MSLRRPPASPYTITQDPYAVIDHISLQQCVGCEGAHFYETTNIPKSLHSLWAEILHDLCSDVSDTIDTITSLPPNDSSLDLALERRLKMFFLFWLLILRKPPSTKNTNPRRITQVIRARMNDWVRRDWLSLIKHYEEDIITSNRTPIPTSTSKTKQQEASLHHCLRNIDQGHIKKATSALLSMGTSDPANPAISAQLKAKHPLRKGDIPPPTLEQLDHQRASFTIDEFRKAVRELNRLISPGLGGARNEYFQALLFHEQSDASAKAKDSLFQLYRFSQHIIQACLPWYF